MKSIALIYRVKGKQGDLESRLRARVRKLAPRINISIFNEIPGGQGGEGSVKELVATSHAIVCLTHADSLAINQLTSNIPSLRDIAPIPPVLELKVSTGGGSGVFASDSYFDWLVECYLCAPLGAKNNSHQIEPVCDEVCAIIESVHQAVAQSEQGFATRATMVEIIKANAPRYQLARHVMQASEAKAEDPGDPSLMPAVLESLQTPVSYVPGRLRHSWIANEVEISARRLGDKDCPPQEIQAFVARSRSYLALLQEYLSKFNSAHCLCYVPCGPEADGTWPNEIAEQLRVQYRSDYERLSGGRALAEVKQALEAVTSATRQALEVLAASGPESGPKRWEVFYEKVQALNGELGRLPVRTGVLVPGGSAAT